MLWIAVAWLATQLWAVRVHRCGFKRWKFMILIRKAKSKQGPQVETHRLVTSGVQVSRYLTEMKCSMLETVKLVVPDVGHGWSWAFYLNSSSNAKNVEITHDVPLANAARQNQVRAAMYYEGSMHETIRTHHCYCKSHTDLVLMLAIRDTMCL